MDDIFKTKLTTTMLIMPPNDPKLLETSWNEPKPAKTTKKIAKQPEMTQKFQNWGNLEFSAKFRF